MSVTYRFTLNDEQARLLESDAQAAGATVQDYIRQRLFPAAPAAIFTPQWAVRQALAKYKRGDRFTLPQLYGSAWTLPAGPAGAFGKKFNEYVVQNYATVFSCDKSGRQAEYTLL